MFISLCWIFTSCDKTSEIGLDVQPEGDLLNVNYSDTTQVLSFTVREDSLRTTSTSLNLLGIYNDPIFGKAQSSIYTQLLLSNANPDFGTSPVVDSVVLSLAYDVNYYGKLDQQTVEVYRLTEDMYKDSTYYSSRDMARLSTDLANAYTFTPKPTDSITIDGVKLRPHLRIRLDDTFGTELLSNQSQYTSDDAFLAFFKGFYITTNDNPATDQGGILYFNLPDAVSKLTLYYKNQADDSLKYEFLINSNCARFSRFNHDYSPATDISNQLSDSTLGQNLTYVQAMAGLKTKIRLPNVKHYTDSGAIAVNKAELIVKVDPATLTTYSPPSNLILIGIDSTGKTFILADAFESNSDGTSRLGGSYNSTKQEYSFIITRHLQFILDGKMNDYGYYLVSSSAAVQANRVVIGGKENPLYPMKFNITYTKLN